MRVPSPKDITACFNKVNNKIFNCKKEDSPEFQVSKPALIVGRMDGFWRWRLVETNCPFRTQQLSPSLQIFSSCLPRPLLTSKSSCLNLKFRLSFFALFTCSFVRCLPGHFSEGQQFHPFIPYIRPAFFHIYLLDKQTLTNSNKETSCHFAGGQNDTPRSAEQHSVQILVGASCSGGWASHSVLQIFHGGL